MRKFPDPKRSEGRIRIRIRIRNDPPGRIQIRIQYNSFGSATLLGSAFVFKTPDPHEMDADPKPWLSEWETLYKLVPRMILWHHLIQLHVLVHLLHKVIELSINQDDYPIHRLTKVTYRYWKNEKKKTFLIVGSVADIKQFRYRYR